MGQRRRRGGLRYPLKNRSSRPPPRRAPGQLGSSGKSSSSFFPFSNQPGNKRRPALVLSQRRFNQGGATVLGMITTAGHQPWPGDVQLTDLAAAGLTAPCLLGLKLFTLDNRLIVKKIGRLAAAAQRRIRAQLQTHLPW